MNARKGCHWSLVIGHLLEYWSARYIQINNAQIQVALQILQDVLSQ